MITRYVKKPVAIEAVQWVGTNEREIISFCEGKAMYSETDGLTIPTLEGTHLARVGDYIIKGIKGEFYPCKPDIFEATYEPETFEDAEVRP